MNVQRLRSLLLFAPVIVACGGAAPAHDGEWLQRAVKNARAGATISIPPGVYDVKDLKISRDVALIGAAEGGVILRSAEATEKGILVPLTGVNLRVENITFDGARSWDRNGAGVRHEGENLTVVNCRFLSNDDGILATGSPTGAISIVRSEFLDSGFGDGQSHGIYVSSGGKLEVVDSKFVGTRIGHHVKSLADVTIVKRTLLDDGHGRSSYSIDASKGGALIVENNTFIQSFNAENYSIINYDLTRGGALGDLRIVGNKITNHYDAGGVFFRNDSKRAPAMAGNEIVNKGRTPLQMTSPGSPKPVAPK
jgi:hypothetical protein